MQLFRPTHSDIHGQSEYRLQTGTANFDESYVRHVKRDLKPSFHSSPESASTLETRWLALAPCLRAAKLNGYINGGMDGWMDGWMDGCSENRVIFIWVRQITCQLLEGA